MESLLLAVKSLLGWAWDILNVPVWIIAMAAVAVDLAFWLLGRLIGSSVASPPTISTKGKEGKGK